MGTRTCTCTCPHMPFTLSCGLESYAHSWLELRFRVKLAGNFGMTLCVSTFQPAKAKTALGTTPGFTCSFHWGMLCRSRKEMLVKTSKGACPCRAKHCHQLIRAFFWGTGFKSLFQWVWNACVQREIAAIGDTDRGPSLEEIRAWVWGPSSDLGTMRNWTSVPCV